MTFSSLTSGGAAFAAGAPLPTGGQFVAGAGAIASAANGLAISQSSTHGIINWQSFSIAAGQTVNIANGTGATLNRVTGGDLSAIAGSLKATGSVYVVNPSGVVVLPGGKVMTGGSFVASTRDVSNSAFMAGGAMTLSGSSSGAVVNQGTITSANGDVILVGKSVTNSGDISAAKGTAALAAGDNVLLQASGDDVVLVNAGSGDVTNSGTIAAAQVKLDAVGGNVYALATNDGGVIRATGTTTKDGHVYLTGGDEVSVDASVSAINADGSGGKIVATGNAVNIGSTARISADGATKGGTILIGGDRHGGTDASVALSKAPVKNATRTNVAAGAKISADAGANGNGGNVVIWSDQSTSYSGAISAKGGTASGDGGFVEVSGKGHLDFTGTATTVAAHGATGTLLLDPSDVTIVDNSGTYVDNTGTLPVTVNYTVPAPTTLENKSTASGTTTYTPTGTGNTTAPANNSSYILNTDIQTQLASNNVVITTTSAGTAAGNILVAAPITWNSASSLTLQADGYIKSVGDTAAITANGTGSITLTAHGSDGPSQFIGIEIDAPISAHGGAININTTDPVSHQGAILFARSTDKITNTTGDINLTTTFNITVLADIKTTAGGNINLVSTGANSLLQIGNTINVQTTGSGSVLLQSDTVQLGSGGEPTLTGHVTTDMTLGKVTVQPSSQGFYGIGDFTSATLLLQDQDIANITTGTLAIGSDGVHAVNGFVGGKTLGLTVSDNLDANSFLILGEDPTVAVPLASVGNLHLISAGFVSENSVDGSYGLAVHGGDGGLAITAGTYIDMGFTGVFGVVANQSPNLAKTISLQLTGTGTSIPAGDNSTTTAASILYAGQSNTGTVTIGTVDGQGGITGASSGVQGVYLTSTGAVAQDTAAANKITATSLNLQGTSFTLDNPLNAIGSIAGSFSSLSLHDNIGLTTAVIDGTSGLNGSGDITIVDNGNLTIANLAAITTTGGNVRLEDQTFTNSDGANAFSVTSGKTWRVYSQDPRNDSNGTLGHSGDGLTYSFVQYNAANSYTTPFTTANAALNGAATGNGFLYTVAPAVTEALSGTFDKVYDGTTAVTGTITAANYSAISGAINGDSVAYNNPTGALVANYSSPHVGFRTISTIAPIVASATDHNGVAVYGYGSSVTGGFSGTISALPITVTGTRVYDGTKDAAGAILTIGNVTAADTGSAPTISGTGAGSLASQNVGARAVTSFTNYTLGNNSFGDYTLAGASGSVTITQAPLTITGVKAYDGTTAFTTGQLTVAGGAISGETVALTAGTGASSSPNASATPYSGSALTGLSINVTGSNTLASNYMLPATGALTINPALLTVSGTKVFDGTTAFSTGQLSVVGGAVNGEVVTLTAGTGTSPSANVATYTTGTTLTGLMVNVTGGNALASNYQVPTTGTLTITPASVTVVMVTGQRVYDGTTNAPGALLMITDKVSPTDDVSLTGTGLNALASKNVGTQTITSFSTYSLSGADANNYTLTGASGSVTITQAPLTITGVKTYDGTTGFATNQLSVSGAVTGEIVTLTSGTGASSSANVATYAGSTLSGTAISVTGTNNLASNYALPATGSLMINPATLTITANNATKTYGQTTTFAGTEFTPTGLQNGETVGTVTLASSGAAATAHVAGSPYAIVASAATGGTFTSTNYSINYVNGALTVNPAALTITANNATKTYGQTKTFAGTEFTPAGLVNGDTVGTVTLTSTGAPATAGVAGSPYAIVASNATGGTFAATDYSVSYINGALTVNPATLTITANNATKTYGQTKTFAGTEFTPTGLQNGETVGTVTLASTGAAATAHVAGSPYAIVASAATGGTFTSTNYSINYVNGALTVNPAALTITANNATKTYGQTKTFAGTEFTPAGLVNGDTVGSVTLTSTGAPATAGVAGSPYAIVASNATGGTFAATDYSVSYANGALTINPLAVILAGTRVYDGTTGASSGILSVTNAVVGDTVTVASGSGTLTTRNVNPTDTITSFGTLALGGGSASNYTLVGATGSVNVTKATLTISAVTQTKVYDGTKTSTGTPTVVGLQTGDTISTTPLAQAYASKNVLGTNGSTLAVTNFSTVNDGNGGGNYNVVVNTAPGTITPEAITVTAVPTTKTYDGTPTSPGTPVVTTGTIYGPDVGTFTQTYNTPHAGTGLTLTPTGMIADTNGGGNYVVTYVPVMTGIINPAALTISAVTQTRVYDGLRDSTGTPTITAGALVAGDTLTGLAQTYDSKNVLGTNGSTLRVTPGFTLSNASDYNVTVLTAPGTITPESITVTGVPTTKTYDGTPTSPGTPVVTTGTIYGPDVGNFTQTYNTPHAGTGLTLTPTGTITDTNGGNNYIITFVPVTTGIINQAALTIAAVTQTRVYDGLRDSTGTPTVTGLKGTDTATNLAQTYDSKNVLGTNGSTLTVTPGFIVTNAGDYNITVNTAKGTITPELLTVTAVPTTKTYDGTPTSPGTPVVTTGTVFGPDVGTFIQTYNTPNAGPNRTLTPSGNVTDGNGGNNYIITFTPITTGLINPKPVILIGTRPFDGTPAAPSPILNITNLIPGDIVTLGGTGTLIAPNVGPEMISSFTGLSLGGGAASNYTFVGATGSVLVTPTAMQNVAESTTVPASQTASGAGETVTFSAFSGGLLTLTPKQNGIVTGTIATIDGTDYHPDTQLGCTLGGDGCVENGVAATPPR